MVSLATLQAVSVVNLVATSITYIYMLRVFFSEAMRPYIFKSFYAVYFIHFTVILPAGILMSIMILIHAPEENSLYVHYSQ